MDAGSCIFCINPRSGGRNGTVIAEYLRRRCGPAAVVDLDTVGPAALAARLAVSSGVVAAGGDGTVAWLLTMLADLPVERRPPLAPLPLGTGNDLARSLGWPAVVGGRRGLDAFLDRLAGARPVRQDTWAFIGPDGVRPCHLYWSAGTDAAVVRRFDLLRRRHPGCCQGRLGNRILYAGLACGTRPHLLEPVLTVTGLALPTWGHCLVASNIRSYAGGSRLDDRIDPADGRLDLHVLGGLGAQALALVGLRRPLRLGRYAAVDLRLHAVLPMQIDGEAVRGRPGDYALRRSGVAVLLQAGGRS